MYHPVCNEDTPVADNVAEKGNGPQAPAALIVVAGGVIHCAFTAFEFNNKADVIAAKSLM